MNLANGSTDMSYVFAGVFVIMMILLPLLTMRLFADEKKLKTDQGLLTAPVNLFEIVMGKFLQQQSFSLWAWQYTFPISL